MRALDRKLWRDLWHMRGQAVAILSETRAEWVFCDLAVLGIGATSMPNSSSIESTASILA